MELNLDRNKIGAEGAKSLGEILKENERLEILGLGWNDIGAEGVKSLCDGLKENESLEELHLHHNKIGGEGAKYLGELLKENRSLIRLAFRESDLDDTSMIRRTIVNELMDNDDLQLESLYGVNLQEYVDILKLPDLYNSKGNEEILAALRKRCEDNITPENLGVFVKSSQ